MTIPSKYTIGDEFQVHFVWQLPDTDFLRAIFKVKVEDINHESDRYVVRLADFVAGRQESHTGEIRPLEAVHPEYWELVRELVGRKVNLAYEVDDGLPIRLRLPTLTREHKFFRRYDV
ncbi:MAG: hypothetical protein OT477_17140 [Chloroflexi bacterium]|nr:hypothetical protein [Chloroflexota bacterium]